MSKASAKGTIFFQFEAEKIHLKSNLIFATTQNDVVSLAMIKKVTAIKYEMTFFLFLLFHCSDSQTKMKSEAMEKQHKIQFQCFMEQTTEQVSAVYQSEE